MTEGQKGGPSEDEYQGQISSIQQIFAEYDHNGSGKVRVERIPELILNLGRDLPIGREVARQLSGSGSVELASFEEVVQTLKKVEETQEREVVDGETTTPLTLLKRLNAYRKQCESNGEYVEAQKARKKYEELRAKEEERQRRLVDQAQQQEMMEVEQAQRAQFLGFSNAWDKYMADYESTAYMSLERLKEQHGEELSKFQEMIRQQPARVKEEGDQLEQWEQARSASLVSDSAKRQEGRLRSQQQKALQALLKRIQRDRGEQSLGIESGQSRNLKADLYKKQHLEFQRAEAAIRSIMSQPEHAQRLLDEHDPASVARSAAMGELPALGRVKWRGPSLPENYTPPGGISKGLVKAKGRNEQSEESSLFGFCLQELCFRAVDRDRFRLGLSIWELRDTKAKDLLDPEEDASHEHDKKQAKEAKQLRFDMVYFETPEQALSIWEAARSSASTRGGAAHVFVRVMLFDAQRPSMAALHFAEVAHSDDASIQADHKALQQLLQDAVAPPAASSSRLLEVLSPLVRGNCKSFLLCTVPERPAHGAEARRLLDLAEQASMITANCHRLEGKHHEDFHWAAQEDVLRKLRMSRSGRSSPVRSPVLEASVSAGPNELDRLLEEALTSSHPPPPRGTKDLVEEPRSPEAKALHAQDLQRPPPPQPLSPKENQAREQSDIRKLRNRATWCLPCAVARAHSVVPFVNEDGPRGDEKRSGVMLPLLVLLATLVTQLVPVTGASHRHQARFLAREPTVKVIDSDAVPVASEQRNESQDEVKIEVVRMQTKMVMPGGSMPTLTSQHGKEAEKTAMKIFTDMFEAWGGKVPDVGSVKALGKEDRGRLVPFGRQEPKMCVSVEVLVPEFTAKDSVTKIIEGRIYKVVEVIGTSTEKASATVAATASAKQHAAVQADASGTASFNTTATAEANYTEPWTDNGRAFAEATDQVTASYQATATAAAGSPVKENDDIITKAKIKIEAHAISVQKATASATRRASATRSAKAIASEGVTVKLSQTGSGQSDAEANRTASATAEDSKTVTKSLDRQACWYPSRS
eukprot:g28503.t1